MSTTEHPTGDLSATHTLTVAQICQAFARWNEAHDSKTPEQAQLDAERYGALTPEARALDSTRYFLELIGAGGDRTAPTAPDIRKALMLRGQRGLVFTDLGDMEPDSAVWWFGYWRGYLRALSELVDGTGAFLARKDAESADEPLSALDRAAQCLGENAHRLTRTEVQERLREAGVEVATNAVANGHAVGAEQLEHGALAAVGLHGDHAAPKVASNHDAVGHGGSVRAEGGAA